MSGDLASQFLGGATPVILVNDKVHHPDNPRQFHYRVQAKTPASEDGETAARHIHIDMEATMRDTTVEVGPAVCEVDNETGAGSFTISQEAAGALEDGAKILIADCVNLDNRVVYGQIEGRGNARSEEADGRVAVPVNTSFKGGTIGKLRASFTKYSMQTYAGPTPIQNSRHLEYMKGLGADPAKKYNELSQRYGRKPPVDTEQLRRRMEEISTDAETLFNCNEVSTDQDNRGCAEFTAEELAMAENLDFTFDGTNYDVSLYCLECAVTVEGASLYANIDSEFKIGSDLVDDAIEWVDGALDDAGDLIDDAGDAAGDLVDDAGDVIDDVGDAAGDVIDDAGNAADDLVDDAGDVIDDVGDAAGDAVDDAGDAIDDAGDAVGDVVDDWSPWRKRKLQALDATAEVNFEYGGDLTGLAVDFSLLLELMLTAEPSSSLDYDFDLFTVYVPNLGIGGSVFGIDLGAGLRFYSAVDPDLSLEGPITAQAGAKLIFDGSFGFKGSVDLDSVNLGVTSGSFNVAKWLDTPRITATVRGYFTFAFTLEMQVGLWADVEYGSGAGFYGALGVPLVIEGTVAGSSDGLLTDIPDSYCTADGGDNSFVFGDCTQPNNLQAQVSIYTNDIYGKVYCGATFALLYGGVGYSYEYAFEYSLDQSQISQFDLSVGPYTLTYCDCILYDGVDCGAQGSGSQCAVEDFPPASERIEPKYTEDSPASGMTKAWEQESIGELDAKVEGGLDAGVIAGIVIGCVVFLVLVASIVYLLIFKKKEMDKKTSGGNVAAIANKFGGQAKKYKAKPTTMAVADNSKQSPKKGKKSSRGQAL